MKNDLQLQLKHNERTAVYIDGANLYHSSRLLNFDIDYERLRQLFNNQCDLWRIYYYTAVGSNVEETPVLGLVSWLDYNGYHTVTKPMRVSYDRDRIKGNMDIEIAIDMLRNAHRGHVDRAILFSGDGDFRCLVAELQQLGTRVTVVSTVRSRPPSCSDDLIRQADHFIDIDTIKSSIIREPRNGGARIQRSSCEDNYQRNHNQDESP
jgi:uncharacterized LabA/DUF88 family protein